MPSLFADDAGVSAQQPEGADGWNAMRAELEPQMQKALSSHPDLEKHIQGQYEDSMKTLAQKLDEASTTAKAGLKKEINNLGQQWQKHPGSIDNAVQVVRTMKENPDYFTSGRLKVESAQPPDTAVAGASASDVKAPAENDAQPWLQQPAAPAPEAAEALPKNSEHSDSAPSAMAAAHASAGGLATPVLGVPSVAGVPAATVAKAAAGVTTVAGTAAGQVGAAVSAGEASAVGAAKSAEAAVGKVGTAVAAGAESAVGAATTAAGKLGATVAADFPSEPKPAMMPVLLTPQRGRRRREGRSPVLLASFL